MKTNTRKERACFINIRNNTEWFITSQMLSVEREHCSHQIRTA
jgi:hypothetical protein